MDDKWLENYKVKYERFEDIKMAIMIPILCVVSLFLVICVLLEVFLKLGA